MRYEFPRDPTLAEFEAAARAANERLGSPVFARMWRGDHVIFQYLYLVNAAFPTVVTREDALLREMRGIVFDAATGKCIARRFHKFKNVGECLDHLPENIDWTVPHVHLEKLDGMMVSPTVFSASDVRWMTKKGHTADGVAAGHAADAARGDYRTLALSMADKGFTPIFEFVGGRRVVVGYEEPRLVLTALRDIDTGLYGDQETLLDLGDRYGVPVVKVHHPMSWAETAEASKTLEGVEGFVVRFHDGHMVKAKTSWYARIHRLLSSIESEQDVWNVILEDHVDDAVAMLPPYAGDALLAFADGFHEGVSVEAARIAAFVEEGRAKVGGDRKRFATEVAAAADPITRGMAFAVWSGTEPRDAVLATLRKAMFRAEARDERRGLIGGRRWVAPQSAEAEYGAD
jgi:RNA ligase